MNKHVDQGNRIRNSDINPWLCGGMIFDKAAKTIQWGKDSSSTNSVVKTGFHMQKELSWTLTFSILKNNNLEWIKVLM